MQKRILVVDDEMDQVQLVCFNLRQAGFSVATAMDGIEALKKARSILPDLILLDLKLPELDGFAVCETLRRDPATASIPIVMLTALSGEFGRLNALAAGAIDYITKPFSPKDLVNRLDRWFSRTTLPVRAETPKLAPEAFSMPEIRVESRLPGPGARSTPRCRPGGA